MENTITINLYYDDLSEDMKKKIIDIFGDNCNWDTTPIATLNIDNSEQHSSRYPQKDILIDSFMGDKNYK